MKSTLSPKLKIRLLKFFIHLISLGYIGILYYRAIHDLSISDPVKMVIHSSGIGALNLLLLTLLVSPLAKVLKAGWLMQNRRLLGLYSGFYALAHFASFILFELQLDLSLLIEEIIKRPYITVGMVALMILSALALTSPDKVKKQLGPRWQKLHNWVYLAVVLVVIHFYWSVKSDITEPVIYGAITLIVLSFRKQRLLKRLRFIGK